MNDYYNAVLQASAYIENHLTTDITLQDIAKIAGFSQYHFMRVFKSLSGHTINNYIKRRRITEAARDILTTNMRILDVAIKFGYNSQEAFTRAFYDVFGVTPASVRARAYDLSNVAQIVLTESFLNAKTASVEPVEPRIVYLDDFLVAGLSFYGNNENYAVPKLWNALRERIGEIGSRIHNEFCYGIESYTQDFFTNGSFEYFAGVEVANDASLPEGIIARRIPKSRYAVFTIPAIVDHIPKSIGEIYGVHLPASGLKALGDYDFEFYDGTFVPNKEDSYFYLYIPVAGTSLPCLSHFATA